IQTFSIILRFFFFLMMGHFPLVSNVAFGFILMGLEKLVELEFECPCNPTWNGAFSSAFFIIPAVMAFTLMQIIQGCRCNVWCRKMVSLSSFVPAVVWLILLFLDGQYFACAMTDWDGRFVLVDKIFENLSENSPSGHSNVSVSTFDNWTSLCVLFLEKFL
uniref:Uncharacterized protein n=1 Tax=Xiphophorus maculatus TaxID=8083 RepID=A0A3B5QTN7_XIPMA